jgi:hypothetical protein
MESSPTLGFSPCVCVLLFFGFFKVLTCKMPCTHYYNLIQSSFTALKNLLVSTHSSSSFIPLATTDLFILLFYLFRMSIFSLNHLLKVLEFYILHLYLDPYLVLCPDLFFLYANVQFSNMICRKDCPISTVYCLCSSINDKLSLVGSVLFIIFVCVYFFLPVPQPLLL